MIRPAMTTGRRSLWVFLLLALTAGPALAQEDHEQVGDPPTLGPQALKVDLSRTPSLTPEQLEYAKAIGRELVCLCGTCPRRLITDCECGWAGMNQKAIQLAVQAGMSGPTIIKAYESVYDIKVRPTPPDEGLGKLSYIFPYIAAAAGLLGVFAFGLRMRGSAVAKRVAEAGGAPVETTITSEAEQALKRELEDLE